MAVNPAKQGEYLNSPVERASELNNPQFENQQGYFNYDLTHEEFITPLFGQITPCMHLDTVPGDRIVCSDNSKLILNQVNGNLLSTLNQYVDTFYVPFRSVFPTNVEKLLPNPTKGDDIPNSALPQVPLFYLFNNYYKGSYTTVNLITSLTEEPIEVTMENVYTNIIDGNELTPDEATVYIPRLLLLTNVISRGQLLDYLGISLDTNRTSSVQSSELQKVIDAFWRELYIERDNYKSSTGDYIRSVKLDLASDSLNLAELTDDVYSIATLSDWRSAISDIFEAGRFPVMDFQFPPQQGLSEAIVDLVTVLDNLFGQYSLYEVYESDYFDSSVVERIDSSSEPFADGGFVNIGKILAYQQIVAQYFTNDTVDNIFSSDLFMQLLRSVMYPTTDVFTSEPTFDFNGVRTEYDYISCAGFGYSLLDNTNISGMANRQYVWMTLMLQLRRSLRWGDYFAVARPNLLAVTEQLSINVEDGAVSPIDVTKNLLLQRYLNAVNYVGSQYLKYMSSIFGIKPSDTGCVPRFISHRKIELENRVTTNTADNQGAQTTNIVGYSDASACDVFIDDIGYIISLTSFDVLPVYKSGIENTYHFSDRFDYFNPMMQNIGDQPIRSSEILGNPSLYTDTFGYTMRNSEYKFKNSRAHGAFVNSLPGYMVSYPLHAFNNSLDSYDINISPDFIRDKPLYLDSVVPQMTGVSPAEYFHFIVSCTNVVHCARKIQATPSVLF